MIPVSYTHLYVYKRQVMYMASMASVPKSLYESAGVDGAGRLVQFFQITIPLIWTNIRTTLTSVSYTHLWTA